MLPFHRENRGVKRKNDYYYIIKPGIFQRKSEETRRRSPSGTFSPGRCRYPKMPYKYFLFCATRQRWFWVIEKKKKFYDFCVRCHIKQKNRQTSRKAATQSYRACNMAASCTFSTIPHMSITSRGGRFPKYKTQSVVPAIWPVRRSFCFVRAWLYFGSNS